MKVLISGFEPFGGSDINPSQQVVEHLQKDADRFPRVQLHSLVLPVVGEVAPKRLIERVQHVAPDAVLCFGEAGRRGVVAIERVFINLRHYRTPDNRGDVVHDRPIVEQGPAAYFSTLPVSQIRSAIASAGVPVEESLSAGAFLCNEVSYSLLHLLRAHRPVIPAGFIHLPRLPEQVVREGDGPDSPTGMPLKMMLAAATAAINAVAQASE